MSAEQNIKTIESVYEAFGRGDAEAILACATDDVDWASEAAGKGAPWYGPHHGKEAVGQFFTELGTACEVEEFVPVSFASNDTEVMTVVRFRVTIRATGKTAAMDLHHWFRFDGNKIAFYRGTEDTAQTLAALEP